MLRQSLLCATVAAAVAACASVPGTGRRQLRLVSVESEMRLGREAFAQAMEQEQVVRSGGDYELVQRVGRRVASAATRLFPDPAREFAWEFVLLDDAETANAWALPGGKCAVYTGLLPITGNEAGLAVVLGHEVAHAIAHHGAERISQTLVTQGVMLGVDLYLGSADTDPEKHADIMNALGLTSSLGVLLPFSRKHENEADELGLSLAAGAGYDPREAIALWQRMAAHSGPSGPQFLSTHPSEGSRIRRLRKHMPKALRIYQDTSPD